MFDIGFWELILISIIALVFIGPERLPGAIRTVGRFVRTTKSMANNIKNELSQELQIDEMQNEFHKVKDNLNMKPQELSKFISINDNINNNINNEENPSSEMGSPSDVTRH